MKNVLLVLAFILLWTFILGLFFVFWGTPDLWDQMHAAAMAHFQSKGA